MLKTAWQLFLGGKLPKKPVRLIGVGISGWAENQPAQADLFEKPEQVNSNQRLLETIDDVTEKFGKHAAGWCIPQTGQTGSLNPDSATFT